MTAETATPAARPPLLLVGAALSAVEGAALAAWGLYMTVAGLVEDTRNQGLNEFGGVVILLMGVLPLAAAWGLLRLRRWGRSPSVLIHTLCLPVAYFMAQIGGLTAALGILIGLFGLLGMVALLTPRVTEALYQSTN
ncbi:hypothetical protein P3T36_002467 [Kitasatospora sp. MAP12-15]|uniref:hypothetical protein n=1 Tax=unclassified Kitasatospora TaxID=2633591 RepID=UPI0024762BB2|nr:hypothetical protein [Kitasatospora sp. MAP12-44]MDH6112748.1 hypothetical protein [Kitasatospora sp. MAP12-44]